MASRLVGGGDVEFKFERVQLFKNQTLGTGSYGAVCKAKCDQLPCAAKLLYPVLFDLNITPQQAQQPGREHRQPQRIFEAECRFLSQIKHPNIVQCLGTYRDPETNAPVLLMELMDESLTHFLETPQNNVLLHIQVNILHDTALALAFLHTNGITHRDLSGNNVLLIAGSRAKVTDFGMSRFADSAPHLATITQCPGTPAYMPPETLSKPPKYSEKLDCFSFGVLIVQTITREFPDPADQHQTMEFPHPTQPSQRIQALICVPELERRQSHISLIPEAHPLRPIALDCLKDSDIERPTAQQLCERLEQLKTTPLYASSVRQIRDRDLLVQSQRETIQENQKQLQDKQQTIQDKDEQLRRVEQENKRLQTQIGQLKQQVDSSEELVAEFQQGMTDKDRQIQQLQTQLQQLELKSDQQQPQPEERKKTDPKELKLTWRKGPKAPKVMMRGSCVLIGNVAYFNTLDIFSSQYIYLFQCHTTRWSSSLQCPNNHSTLTNINNMLTTIGGTDPIRYADTNKVMTYHDQKWVELYPPMPTERKWAAVLSTTTHVVVIGGRRIQTGGKALNTTEILNIETMQWSKATPLPYGISSASATLCQGTLYLMGVDGITDSKYHYSVLSCQLRDLVEQSTPSTQRLPSSPHSKVWHRLPDLPVRRSTSVTVQGHVLAIGGRDKQNKDSSLIHRYDQERNQWVVINNMTIARSACLATVLPDNNLLVVGGVTEGGKETDETEIAKVT